MHKGSNLSSINKNIAACQMLHYSNANKSENDEKTLFARISHVRLLIFFCFLPILSNMLTLDSEYDYFFLVRFDEDSDGGSRKPFDRQYTNIIGLYLLLILVSDVHALRYT